MDKSTIQCARQADLAEYLLSVGVPLEKCGSRYRHKEHDSLIFTKNSYYWNSRQEHGNAIDYLVRHMDMGFTSAVSALVKVPIDSPMTAVDNGRKVFELDPTSFAPTQDKVRKYLKNARAIGYDIIYHLTENRLLFQEKLTNNAVFPIYDENNICVGAEIHGILDKRFKSVKKGSKYGYGFNIRFSNDNTYDYALFFESAIDLLSFIDYTRKHEKKTLNRCILISMAGLKINIVRQSIKAFDGEMKVVLCVDNNESGQEFKNTLKTAKISYIDRSPDENFKDWNEQILASKPQKVISRVLDRYSLTPNNTGVKEVPPQLSDRPK